MVSPLSISYAAWAEAGSSWFPKTTLAKVTDDPSVASPVNNAQPREFLVVQTVKNPPAMRETWFRSLGWEDPLEEGMATHSSILAWRIPMDRGAWQATVQSQTQLSN